MKKVVYIGGKFTGKNSWDEAHDAAERHGRVLSVRIHLGNREWVYGLAEIEPHTKGETDGHENR